MLDPFVSLTNIAAHTKTLRRAEKEYERPSDLGPLEISVTPNPRKPWEAKAFADLGVTRPIVTPPRAAGGDVDELVRFVETTSSSG